MTDLNNLTRDQIGEAEWAEIRRRLERLEQAEHISKLAAEHWEEFKQTEAKLKERLEKCEADSKILDWLEQYSSFCVHTYTVAGKPLVHIDGGAGTAMHTRGSSLRDAARAAMEGK